MRLAKAMWMVIPGSALLGGDVSSPTELVFSVQPGSELTKRFVLTIDLSSRVSGVEVTCEHGTSHDEKKEGGSYRVERVVQISDEYATVTGGRPGELRRSFEAVSAGFALENGASSFREGGWSEAWEATGTLQDEAVVFSWKAENDRYAVRFEPEREDAEEALTWLREDMDLRAVLPGRAVEVGEEWDIDAHGLDDLLFPGGRIEVPPGDADPVLEEWASVHIAPVPNLPTDPSLWLVGGEGRATAILTSIGGADGVELATVHVRFEYRSKTDVLPWIRKRMGEFDEVVPYERGTVDLRLEGEGDLRWNLVLGRFEDFRWEAKASIDYDLGFTFSWDAPQWEDFHCALVEVWKGTMSGQCVADPPATRRR